MTGQFFNQLAPGKLENAEPIADVGTFEAGEVGPAMRKGPILRSRHLIYLQLAAAILSVLFGLEVHPFDPNAFDPVVTALFFSSFLFPLVVVVRLMTETRRERWSWLVIPFSLSLSYIQFRAICLLVA